MTSKWRIHDELNVVRVRPLTAFDCSRATATSARSIRQEMRRFSVTVRPVGISIGIRLMMETKLSFLVFDNQTFSSFNFPSPNFIAQFHRLVSSLNFSNGGAIAKRPLANAV